MLHLLHDYKMNMYLPAYLPGPCVLAFVTMHQTVIYLLIPYINLARTFVVISCNQPHGTKCRPYKAGDTAGTEASASASAASGSPAAAASSSGPAATFLTSTTPARAILVIEEVYKPGRELHPVFKELGYK